MSDLDPVPTLPAADPVPTAYAAAVLDYLAEEGFRPRLDEDGDVYFKYEGSTYIVVTGTNDPTALAVVLPYFWPLEDAAERTRALEAAMLAQHSVRIGRVTVFDDNVSASVNAYLPDADSFRAVLLRSVDGLRFLSVQFREQMRAVGELRSCGRQSPASSRQGRRHTPSPEAPPRTHPEPPSPWGMYRRGRPYRTSYSET
ncbi:hypothetical protein V3W47_15090 [Deinococcus sp. YIM 134068]|uniref:hypothetical protein n=1 Tax=Deinococcus lichenicola TaxID=3118910 RepID=UPI002F94171E